MTIKEFEDNLRKIDNGLFVVHTDDDPCDSIYVYTNPIDRYDPKEIYDFGHNKFNYENCRKYIPGKVDALRTLIFNFTHNFEDESKLIKNMKKWLLDINLYFELITDHNNKPVKIIYHQDNKQLLLYNFHMKNFYYNYLTSITSPEFYALQNVVNDYWQKSKDSQKTSKDSESKNGLTKDFHLFASKDFQKKSNNLTINTLYEDWVNNPFRSYTEHLAETLQAKNAAYGDSFTKSVDDYGLKVIGIRLSDKYNRIKHLVNNGELKENDESLEDTLLDMAGYSILALKYLKEHKNESKRSY